jgi:hypothetical protein
VKAVKLGRGATSTVLLALAAGALGYAYFFDRGGGSAPDRARGAGRVFPELDVGGVLSLTLDRGGERLALERETDAGSTGWKMTSPHAEPADPATVDALLEDMSLTARLRSVSIDDAAAGLASPRARGRVRLGAIEYAFALGSPAPVPDGASYMRVEGGGTFVVDRLLAEDLLRGADAYRDRTLVPYGASGTARVEVRDPGAGGGFVLTRAGVTFRLDASVRASRSAVERLFAGLSGAHADSFIAGADAGTPAGSGGLAVRLEPTSPSVPPVDLGFGAACPGNPQDVLVTVSGVIAGVACVPETVAAALRAPRASLVDEGLFHARADEIAELRFESLVPDAPSLDLGRKGTGWHERAPRDRALDGAGVDAANALAERLTTSRAKSVRPGASGDRFPARSRVTVVRVDGVAEGVEVAAPAADGSVPVRRLDDAAVLTMAKDALPDLEGRSLR